MMKLSKEQQIEICNAINTAVARGKTVQVGHTRVVGAYPCLNGVAAIIATAPFRADEVVWIRGDAEVRSFIPAETDVDVILEPPPATASTAEAMSHGLVPKSSMEASQGDVGNDDVGGIAATSGIHCDVK